MKGKVTTLTKSSSQVRPSFPAFLAFLKGPLRVSVQCMVLFTYSFE